MEPGQTLLIIANPAAGKGKGRRQVARVRERLAASGIETTLQVTERPGHATELARRAADDGLPVAVALGGDGTVREVAEGLVGTETALGVLPLGSGNDFARSLGIPLTVAGAGRVLQNGRIAEVDVGFDRSGVFTCLSGIGYAAEVSFHAGKSRLFRGSAAYFAGVFKALAQLRPMGIRLILDTETVETDAVFVLAQNTPYCGGGQFMAPEARLHDGMLDVVVVLPIGRLELVKTFPKVYSGKHVHHPAFRLYRSRTVRIESSSPIRKILDGDVVGEEPLESRIEAGGLRVVVPADYSAASSEAFVGMP